MSIKNFFGYLPPAASGIWQYNGQKSFQRKNRFDYLVLFIFKYCDKLAAVVNLSMPVLLIFSHREKRTDFETSFWCLILVVLRRFVCHR